MVDKQPNSDLVDQLLDELDVASSAQLEGRADSDVCQRNNTRHPFRAECIVRFMPAGTTTISELPGRTRNLSCNGLGLLVRRVFRLGDPMEVEVRLAGRPTMYMAGLVSFCRYAGGGYHEVGIRLRAAKPEPVFSSNVSQALKSLDWLQAAHCSVPA